jgi:hypothetical protein
MLESWRGKPYDDAQKPNPVKRIGHAALLNIVHQVGASGNTFAKIDAVTPPMVDPKSLIPTVPTVVWDLKDNGISLTSWPDWLRGRYLPIHRCSIEDYVGSSYEGRGLPVPTKSKQAPAAAVPAGASANGDDPPF